MYVIDRSLNYRSKYEIILRIYNCANLLQKQKYFPSANGTYRDKMALGKLDWLIKGTVIRLTDCWMLLLLCCLFSPSQSQLEIIYH